jgi:hypothetical protein
MLLIAARAPIRALCLLFALAVTCLPARAHDDNDRDHDRREAERDPDFRHGKVTFCRDALDGRYDHVWVPTGAACSLSGAQVRGNVRVSRRASLLVDQGTTIEGRIRAEHCRTVQLQGAASVHGDVHIGHCSADSGYTGPGIEIGGDFVCHDNAGRCLAQGGSVRGDVLISDNTSAAPSDVSLNTIRGRLKCEGNSPAPAHALGANKVRGRTLAQCASGFELVQAPAVMGVIGAEGGTLDTPEGTALAVPAGALPRAAAVALRTVALSEVEVALQSSAFQGQKLAFLGAAEIESSVARFAEPVVLSIPNAAGLPADAQVLVAQVVADLTGDGIADLVLVDDAVVTGGRIVDANPLLPRVREPGVYAFLAPKSPARYSFVRGSVSGPTGAPAAGATVWNSSAPDMVALAGADGGFATAVLNAVESATFMAASRTLNLFGAATIANPGAGNLPLRLTEAARARLCEELLCRAEPTPREEVLNKLAEALQAPVKSALENNGPESLKLSLDPASPLAVGQTSTVTPQVEEFIRAKDLGQLSFDIEAKLRQPQPYCPVSVSYRLVPKLELARAVGAVVQLRESDPSKGVIELTALPGPLARYSAQGKKPGSSAISGEMLLMELSLQAQVEIKTPEGRLCPPAEAELPSLKLDLSGKVVPVESTPLTVAASGRVTMDLEGANTNGGTVSGAALAGYLATFGISTPSAGAVAVDTRTLATYINSPTTNILSGGDGRDPTTLILEFASPVSDLRFLRAGIVGANSPSGTIAGPWSATAYDAGGNPIASVQEDFVAFFGDRAPLQFSLGGAGITRLVFQGFDFGFAGINIPHITNLSFER